MDDEQGPWWTRPPEPGPQAPVVSRPEEEPDDGIVTPRSVTPLHGRAGEQPGEHEGTQLDEPGEPPAVEEPPQFETWGAGFATPPAGANPWEAHPGLFTESQPSEPPTSEPPTTEDDANPAPQEQEQFPEREPQRPRAATETVVSPSPIMKPRPQIRRMAVVDPNPPVSPPPSALADPHPSNDRTETLPALGDDIFAVFDAQGTQRTQDAPGNLGRPDPGAPVPPPYDPYRAGPASDDPLSHLRDEPHPHRGVHLPHVQMPEPRFLLMAVGSGLVVLLVLLVVLLFGRGGDGDKQTATPAPVGSGKAVATTPAGSTPDGLKKLSSGQASELLARAGQGANGQIHEAWTWNDKNGRNLVVTTTEVTAANRQTLRVIHVGDLDGDPHPLRVMTDPNLPDCKNKAAVGAAAFTTGAMVVRDVNSDGIAEVTAGWTSRCGARSGTSSIKLAMISNGKKFIIRDEGVVGKAGAGAADPKSGDWPKGFYPALNKLYKKLYS